MADITLTFKAQVSGGPTISPPAHRMSVEAYEQIHLTLEPGDTDIAVQLGASEQFSLLVIHSDLYSETDEIQYGLAAPASIVLDQLQAYSGGAAQAFLTSPTLVFSNGFSAPGADDPSRTANVTSLVGRDVTPDAP